MRYLLLRLKRFCGFIAGFVFFISGLLKLMDPVGTGLVMQEYYDFFHVGFMDFSAKFMGTAFALTETAVGAGLVTGVWRRTTAVIAVCMQGFFTFLTLLLVIFNPEMDCGCFGEAVHLTHMQTFMKNIALMALLLIYYLPHKHLGETKKKKYISFALIAVSVTAFAVWSWTHIPLVDYTAYKPGTVLTVAAETDTDSMFESIFVYEKDGMQEEFTLDRLPDSTWTFLNTETRMVKGADKGLAGLSFRVAESGEYMDSLAVKGKVMVVSVYDTHMPERGWRRVERFIRRSEDAGFTTLLLCASIEGIPESVKNAAYISDYKTLISLNRSNGGVTYFHNGELIKKWAAISAPGTKELAEVFADEGTEVYMAHESKGSLAFQGFLLYVFAVMLLL